MIRDLNTGQPGSQPLADVCIVGAGAAGIILAVELSRLGKTVTLLEAGGVLVEEAAQDPLRSEVDRDGRGLAHRGIHEGRVRALGGTTTKWGGQVLELDDLDLQQRSWVKGPGWPFPKEELAHYYQRALVMEGLSPALLTDDSVWTALGLPAPYFPPLSTYLSRWCPEPNFARLHREAMEGEGIAVWTHANAVGLSMEGPQITGVRCRSLSGEETVFRAAQYCFCLGAIESSRFFLQPRAQGLPWNQSGLLGKYFQDHVDCTAALVQPTDPKRVHDSFDAIFYRGFKYNPKLKLGPELAAREHLLQVGATLTSGDGGAEDPLLSTKELAKKLLRRRFSEIRPQEALHTLRQAPAVLRHGYRFAMKHRAYHAAGAPLWLRVHCEQEPEGSSSITLSSERDEFGLYRSRLNWRVAETELRTIRCFVDLVQSAMAGVATIHPIEDLQDERLLLHCEDSFHHMGGMRMGRTELTGVVDANLRLYGTVNAFVCSSAVFPSSGFSNPTHTLLALAVRLAQHLTS